MMDFVNRKLKWFLLILGLIVGIPVGLAWNRNMQAHRRLDEQLELARKDGIPMSGAEYAKLVPTAKPEENAAPLYRKLKYKMLSGFAAVARMAPFDRSANAQVVRKKLLQDAKSDLSLLDEATKLPHCWFDRDWSKGAALLFPELPKLREAAWLLGLRGSVTAGAGATQQALADANRIFTLSDHAREEGSELGNMVALTLYNMGLNQLAAWSFAYQSEPAYRAALAAHLGKFNAPSLRQQHADDLWTLISVLDMSTTPEGLKDLGLKPADVSGLERVAPLLLNRTDAKANIIRNYRLIWEQLGQPKPNEQVIKDAEGEMLKSSFAFPTGIDIYSKLMSGELGTFAEMGRNNLRDTAASTQARYVAISRALVNGHPAKSIKTSDLTEPTGKPVMYEFDGKTMRITTHIADRDITFTLPPSGMTHTP